MGDNPTTRRFRLDASSGGRRLDHVIAQLLPALSRTRVQNFIRAGAVRLDGIVTVKPGLLVTSQGALEIEMAFPDSRAVTPELDLDPCLLHVDEALLALDKPAGFLTHANAPGGELGVAEFLSRRFGPLPAREGRRPGVAHRLDRDTSGVLVLGRTEAALAHLLRGFRERTIEKTYVAIVRGDPRFDSEWIEARLGRTARARDRISVVGEGEGREAVTFYQVRERFGEFALLDVQPKTGRTHQVRVHLAHIGLPLLGDDLYVPKRRMLPKLPSGAPAITRQALHAARLRLTHPTSGAELVLEAPLPRDLADIVAWLRAR